MAKLEQTHTPHTSLLKSEMLKTQDTSSFSDDPDSTEQVFSYPVGALWPASAIPGVFPSNTGPHSKVAWHASAGFCPLALRGSHSIKGLSSGQWREVKPGESSVSDQLVADFIIY